MTEAKMQTKRDYAKKENGNLVRLVLLVTVSVLASFSVASTILAQDPKKEKKRTEIRKMSQDTLQRLYKSQPSAKRAIEGAKGYAVFASTGVKLGLAGSGRGQGVAVNNANKNETFMKM